MIAAFTAGILVGGGVVAVFLTLWVYRAMKP